MAAWPSSQSVHMEPSKRMGKSTVTFQEDLTISVLLDAGLGAELGETISGSEGKLTSQRWLFR